MINPFVIAESVTTAREYGGHLPSVQYNEYSDDLYECAAQSSYDIATANTEINETFCAINDILTEAAFQNPDRLDILTEASLDAVVDGVKKFFGRMAEIARGILEQLKGYFYKTMGNVDKWLTTMLPRINKAKGQPGTAEVSAEVYKYDVEYICEKMPGAVKELLNNWKAKVTTPVQEGEKIITGIETMRDMYTEGLKTKTSYTVDDFKSDSDTYRNNLETHKREFSNEVGHALGCTAAADLSSVYSEAARRARGDATQKMMVTYGGDVDKYISSLQGSTNRMKELTKTYDGYIKELSNYQKKLHSIKLDKKAGREEGGAGADAARAAQSAFHSMMQYVTKMTGLYHAAADKIRSLSMALHREMCKSYMTMLTKFCSAAKTSK